MSNYYPVNKSYGDKNNCKQGGGHNHDHNYDKGCYNHNEVDCKPNKTILRCKETCGTSISVTIPDPAVPVVTAPTVIGNISVRDLCCFKNPCVKLDISSIVSGSSVAGGAAVTLQYQISRRCDVERDFRVVKTVTALSIGLGTTPGTIPISLSVCDCEDFCRRYSCCDYEVAIIATVTGTAGDVVTINPNYTSLSIVAGEGNC